MRRLLVAMLAGLAVTSCELLDPSPGPDPAGALSEVPADDGGPELPADGGTAGDGGFGFHDGGAVVDGGSQRDGGNAEDGGEALDGGPAPDGGEAADGGSALDGGQAQDGGGGLDGGPTPDGGAGGAPIVTDTDYAIATVGGALTVHGTGFTGATGLTLGGTSQAFVVDSDTTLRIAAVGSRTPTGRQPLVVTSSAGSSAPFTVRVLRLTPDYTVLAHGAALVLTGSGADLSGTGSLLIGGVSQQFNGALATQVTVPVLDETTPLCVQNVQLTLAAGATAPTPIVTIIHLVLNELDPDQVGFDTKEFVEIATGLDQCPDGHGGVLSSSLTGYAIAFYDGYDSAVYLSGDMNAVTDNNGLLLIGDDGVVPAPALTLGPGGAILNGTSTSAAAVALFQESSGGDYTFGALVTNVGLLDAMVYNSEGNTATSPNLLDVLLGTGPQRIQLHDNTTTSIQRCNGRTARLDGRSFGTGIPSPGAPNPAGLACPPP
jgi:hypothetical protein